MKNQQNTPHHNDGKTPPAPALSQALTEHLDALRVRQFSPATLAIYQYCLRDFLAFLTGRGRQRAQEVSPEDLEAFRLSLIERPLTSATLQVYVGSVRQFFAHLERTQQLFLNPAENFRPPSGPRKLLPVPSEDEILRLLNQPRVSTRCGLRDRALLETGYGTGMRLGELRGLNLSDLDLARHQVRVLGKGSKERVLPLGKQAVHWLQCYLSAARPKLLNGRTDEALWIDRHGKRMGGQSVRLVISHHARAAQLPAPLSPHGLRRACATHMLRRGAHPAQLRMLLGHATFGTLRHYLRVTITDLKTTHASSNPGK